MYKKMDDHYWSNTEPPQMAMLGFLEEPVIEAIPKPEFQDAPKDRGLAGAQDWSDQSHNFLREIKFLQ